MRTKCQSTSNWIKVKSALDSQFANQTIKRNQNYITISFLTSRIYDNQNWYSKFISGDPIAFVTINVSSDLGFKKLEDRRTSQKVDINDKKNSIEIGYVGQPIVEDLPTYFNDLRIDVSLSYAAKDKLSDIISIGSSISSNFAPLTANQVYNNVASGAKQLLDEIFNKKLAFNFLVSNSSPIGYSTGSNSPGIYVIFGGNSKSDYEKYINQDSLVWANNDLYFNNKQLPSQLIYFVIKVTSISQKYDVIDKNILAPYDKAWQKFYEKAFQSVSGLNDISDTSKSRKDIYASLASGYSLLADDQDLLPNEKTKIDLALKKEISQNYFSKVSSLTKGGEFNILIWPLNFDEHLNK